MSRKYSRLGKKMICPTCAFKWHRPHNEPANKPCPKCFSPVLVKMNKRKTTTEYLADEWKGNVVADVRTITKGKKSDGIPMVCPTCAFNWRRPPSEPADKPCPKCHNPVQLRGKYARKTTTEYLADERKGIYVANVRTITKGKKSDGRKMICPTCEFKWRRPINEPDSKPCPKCNTSLQSRKAPLTITQKIALEKVNRRYY